MSKMLTDQVKAIKLLRIFNELTVAIIRNYESKHDLDKEHLHNVEKDCLRRLIELLNEKS